MNGNFKTSVKKGEIMMRKPKVVMIGLGSIAQRVYLPILSKNSNLELIGAFTTNADKRAQLCDQYRIENFNSIEEAIEKADAVFVHSSTETHYVIVKQCLEAGKDVYVDKPLAETIEQAEKLVHLAESLNRKLMVGFNRRFAPLYNELKSKSTLATSFRIEKHRMNNIGPQDWIFTMFDDYLHLVDTARWLAGDELKMVYNKIVVTNDGSLLSAHHVFETPQMITITTEMHRNAGTRLEELAVITDGQIIRVKNLNTIEYEKENKLHIQSADDTKVDHFYRGFEASIAYFIDCVINDKMPSVDGFESLKSQQLVADIINSFPKREFK